MEESSKRESREEIFSRVVRAGKRTYFFDVKETRKKERYLTITESKRRFNNETGKFFYEKHKLFLYREDFDKFSDGLEAVIGFIKDGNEYGDREPEPAGESDHEKAAEHEKKISDISFEDLGEEKKDDADKKQEEDKKKEDEDDDKTS